MATESIPERRAKKTLSVRIEQQHESLKQWMHDRCILEVVASLLTLLPSSVICVVGLYLGLDLVFAGRFMVLTVATASMGLCMSACRDVFALVRGLEPLNRQLLTVWGMEVDKNDSSAKMIKEASDSLNTHAVELLVEHRVYQVWAAVTVLFWACAAGNFLRFATKLNVAAVSTSDGVLQAPPLDALDVTAFGMCGVAFGMALIKVWLNAKLQRKLRLAIGGIPPKLCMDMVLGNSV
ncbi:MAG: hypothetical protein R3C17_02755 [Planctomycetaceae bacterium]